MSYQDLKTGEVILYINPDGSAGVDVRLENDTVWLSQAQMTELFDRSAPTINEHIKTIYGEGELESDRTIRKFRIVREEGLRRVEREIDFYNLDMIISVGYRVNSKRGTQFRIWANSVLKDYLLKGYALNHAKLSNDQIQQFQQALSLFPQTVERLSIRKELTNEESIALMKLVTDYASSWAILQQYDDGKLKAVEHGSEPTFTIDYTESRKAIDTLKSDLLNKGEASDLFGNEYDKSFKGLLGNIYQTFGGVELYPLIEHKAAHLLYFVIKDHPFSDGNKRIGALLFIFYLQSNNYLVDAQGRSKIDQNTLVALALLVAESNPNQKDIMIALIMHLLQG